jgi:hypothetical protein
MKLGEILQATNATVRGDELFLMHEAQRMWEVRCMHYAAQKPERIQRPCLSRSLDGLVTQHVFGPLPHVHTCCACTACACHDACMLTVLLVQGVYAADEIDRIAASDCLDRICRARHAMLEELQQEQAELQMDDWQDTADTAGELMGSGDEHLSADGTGGTDGMQVDSDAGAVLPVCRDDVPEDDQWA